MVGRGNDDTFRGSRTRTAQVLPNEELPYSIALWTSNGEKIERTLARAVSNHLARAIFAAAQIEFPGRRITLQRSADIIADNHATITRP